MKALKPSFAALLALLYTLLMLHAAIAVECGDSDASYFIADGKAYSMPGTTRGVLAGSAEEAEFSDYCLSPKVLIEYFCTADGYVQFNRVICPKGCSEGACDEPPYCYDTDGGAEPTRRGRLFVITESHLDAPDTSLGEEPVDVEVQREVLNERRMTSEQWVEQSEGRREQQAPLTFPQPQGSSEPIAMDRCKDGTTLIEYRCKEDDEAAAYTSVEMACPVRCARGKCVKEAAEAAEEAEERPDFELPFGSAMPVKEHIVTASGSRLVAEQETTIRAGQNEIEDFEFMLVSPSLELVVGGLGAIEGYSYSLSDAIDEMILERVVTLPQRANIVEGNSFTLVSPSLELVVGGLGAIEGYSYSLSDATDEMILERVVTLSQGENTVEGRSFTLSYPQEAAIEISPGSRIDIDGYEASVSADFGRLTLASSITLREGANQVEGTAFVLNAPRQQAQQPASATTTTTSPTTKTAATSQTSTATTSPTSSKPILSFLRR